MASRIKPSEAGAKARGGIDPKELRKIVTDINRHKKLASESTGMAGKATQSAAEAHGLDKGALTQCCKLDKQEPPKRQAYLRSLLDYAEKLGFFNEIDAFDDTVSILEGIVARARSKGKAKPQEPVSDLLNKTGKKGDGDGAVVN